MQISWPLVLLSYFFIFLTQMLRMLLRMLFTETLQMHCLPGILQFKMYRMSFKQHTVQNNARFIVYLVSQFYCTEHYLDGMLFRQMLGLLFTWYIVSNVQNIQIACCLDICQVHCLPYLVCQFPLGRHGSIYSCW